MARPSSNAPERLLDAAEAVILRSGVASLTLDAVAAEAGMSKGGLLYHLPTKEKLIEALLLRCAEQLKAGIQCARDRLPEGPGRLTRGPVEQLSDKEIWSESMRGTSLAIVTALAATPDLIQPLREVYTGLYEELQQDGLPPGVAEALVAATDGLWLMWLLGLVPVNAAFIAKTQSALRSMLEQVLADSGAAAPPDKN
ncbi:MAG: TetR/AcrR family transcriptional regulator [Planctomycetota bacterium]